MRESIESLRATAWMLHSESPEPSAASSLDALHDTELPASRLTAEEFTASVFQSGLLPREEIEGLKQRLAASDLSGEARAVATRLVTEGKLTRYQASVLLKASSDPLLIDNYIILDTLDTGGMGLVFKALHRSMNRVVALKLLPASMRSARDTVKRFQREVKAAAALKHPNVVAAYDADESSEIAYLVLEYVEGTNLFRLVKNEGPLPVGRHRRLRPPGGRRLGLLAFPRHHPPRRQAGQSDSGDRRHGEAARHGAGAVRLFRKSLLRGDGPGTDAGGHRDRHGGVHVPRAGLGHPFGRQRSDVYSLGCTLFFLMTGRTLYHEETGMKTLLAHREEAVPTLRRALRRRAGVVGRGISHDGRQAAVRSVAIDDRGDGRPGRLRAGAAVGEPGKARRVTGRVHASSSQVGSLVDDLRDDGRRPGNSDRGSRRIFAGILIRVKSDRGTTELYVDDPNASVEVKQVPELPAHRQVGSTTRPTLPSRIPIQVPEVGSATGKNVFPRRGGKRTRASERGGMTSLSATTTSISRPKAAIPQSSVEVQLGDFLVANLTRPGDATRIGLAVTVPNPDENKMEQWRNSHERRIRQALVRVLQGKKLDQLSDTELEAVRKKVVDAFNEVLPAPIIQQVFIEWVIEENAKPRATAATQTRQTGQPPDLIAAIEKERDPDRAVALWIQSGAVVGRMQVDDLPGVFTGIPAQTFKIRTIELRGSNEIKIPPVVVRRMNELSALKELSLSGGAGNDAVLEEIQGLIHLEKLNLSHSRISNAGLQWLAGMKSLSLLDLSDTKITDDGLKILAKIRLFSHLPRLSTEPSGTLQLSGTATTEAGIDAFRRTEPHCTVLSANVIGNGNRPLPPLPGSGDRAWAEWILTNVGSVSLRTDVDPETLVRTVPEIPPIDFHIQAIEFYDNFFYGSPMPPNTAILRHFADLGHLQSLSFGDNSPAPEIGKHEWKILDGVAVLRHLKSLYVRFPVPDEELASVAKLTQLERLQVNGLLITDAGVKQLAPLHELTSLTLTGPTPHVQGTGLKALVGLKNSLS